MTGEERGDWRRALRRMPPSEEELKRMPAWRQELWRLIEEARAEASEEERATPGDGR